MKPSLLLLVVPLSLGLGFIAGKKSPAAAPSKQEDASRTSREKRPPPRASRADPFGGPSFAVDSLEDIRELFRNQRQEVASARLTLAVESLPAKEIPRIMDIVREDFRNRPNEFDQSRYTLMSTLFAKWTSNDPAGAFEFVNSSKQRSFRNYASREYFSSLAEVDPTRALSELRSLPKGEMREGAAPGVIAQIGKKDPQAACDLLASEPSRSGWGDYYTRNIMAQWAEKDPAAAAAKLASMPEEIAGDYTASGVAAKWAKTDPDAALAWAKSLKGDRKLAACQEIYASLTLEDPAAAWDKIKGEPGHLRGALAGRVLGVIADEDPKKAIAMLNSMGTPSEKRLATRELLERLNWSETRLALEIVNQLDDSATRREQIGNLMYYAAWSSSDLLAEQTSRLTEREKVDTAGQVISGLARTDPKKAREYFLSLPEAQRPTDALRQMMGEVASKDPKGSLDFALSLTNPQEQNAAVTGLFASWGKESPEEAAQGLKKLPAGQGRLEALNSIASAWARTDPEAASQWAETLSGPEKARALAAVLPALAKDNPSSAGQRLSALIASPPDGMAKNLANSASTLASSWAADDPSSAASWAGALPEGQSRDAGLGAVAKAWTQYDAVAASQWIGTLPTGSSRDAAVKPLVAQVRQTDPATAFTWAASISDAEDRVSQMRDTLKSWRGTDLNAARAALNGAQLTEAEHAKLLKEVE